MKRGLTKFNTKNFNRDRIGSIKKSYFAGKVHPRNASDSDAVVFDEAECTRSIARGVLCEKYCVRSYEEWGVLYEATSSIIIDTNAGTHGVLGDSSATDQNTTNQHDQC